MNVIFYNTYTQEKTVMDLPEYPHLHDHIMLNDKEYQIKKVLWDFKNNLIKYNIM